jgi:hypothetical protein
MVTPEISGLVNGDALAALTSKGIQCGTGDNTWAHLRNLAAPHQMLYTTQALSNFAGFAVLPRFATGGRGTGCSAPVCSELLQFRLQS